jgi:hypothetical protein
MNAASGRMQRPLQWERWPKQGLAPSVRSSFSMVPHKNRAFLFGGAADQEAKKGEVIVSQFFNDIYQLNVTQQRWFPVAMRLPKDGQAAGAAALFWTVTLPCLMPHSAK